MHPSDAVRSLVDLPPPVITLYLPATPTAPDASDHLRIEWQQARRQLEDEGATAEQLDLVDDLLTSEPAPRSPTAIVVGGDLGAFQADLDDVEGAPIARCSPLPSLVPLLAWAQAQVPHIVVLADRRGADIVTVAPGGEGAVRTVDGDTEHLRKVAGGGWSHRRYQQTAENTWEQNAAGVAAEVATAAHRIGAEVVVAAGDERAVGFLEQHLPTELRERLRTTDHGGGRAVDGSADLVVGDVDRAVRTVVAERTVHDLGRFGELLASDGAAVEGAADTLAALREALVDRLYVHDDPNDDRTAWFSPSSATLVALERELLDDLGRHDLEEARLVDVAVWSAIGTGASVAVVPAHGRHVPANHLGAHLRAAI